MRKRWPLLTVLLTLLFSCSEQKEKEVARHSLCPNALLLLCSDTTEVIFNHRLTIESILESLSAQTGRHLCNERNLLTCKLKYSGIDTVGIRLATNRYCPDVDYAIPYCGPRNSMTILVNNQSKILFEDNVATVEELDSLIKEHVKNNDTRTALGQVGYYIDWTDSVDVELRETILKTAIDAYLSLADSVAIEKTGNKLCEIGYEQLAKVKSEFGMWIEIGTEHKRPILDIPLPPERKEK